MNFNFLKLCYDKLLTSCNKVDNLFRLLLCNSHVASKNVRRPCTETSISDMLDNNATSLIICTYCTIRIEYQFRISYNNK